LKDFAPTLNQREGKGREMKYGCLHVSNEDKIKSFLQKKCLYNHFTTWSGFPCALPSDEIFLKELEF
jgi:hypothetical protein